MARSVCSFRCSGGFIAAVGINEGPCFHGDRVAVQISFYYLPPGNLFGNERRTVGARHSRALAATTRWHLPVRMEEG